MSFYLLPIIRNGYSCIPYIDVKKIIRLMEELMKDLTRKHIIYCSNYNWQIQVVVFMLFLINHIYYQTTAALFLCLLCTVK